MSSARYVHQRAGTPGSDEPMSGLGDLALFLGGSEDSFVGQLLRLLAKVDEDNRARLALAYPEVVLAWDTWNSMTPSPTADELSAALVAVAVTAGLDENVARGYLVTELGEDGEPRYRVTAAGIKHVLDMGERE